MGTRIEFISGWVLLLIGDHNYVIRNMYRIILYVDFKYNIHKIMYHNECMGAEYHTTVSTSLDAIHKIKYWLCRNDVLKTNQEMTLSALSNFLILLHPPSGVRPLFTVCKHIVQKKIIIFIEIIVFQINAIFLCIETQFTSILFVEEWKYKCNSLV